MSTEPSMSFVDLVSADVEQVIGRFEGFHLRFASHFATRTRDMSPQAAQYLQGQFTCQGENNLKAFEKWVPETDYQSLHHFISRSPWEDKPVIDDIAQSVKPLIGSVEYGSLHIDESGLPKQGSHSVGVTRQYCGRLGKVDNCQMGVFLGYTNGSSRILVDKRLYLPQSWTKDKARMKQCGVPEEVEFQTKAQLGLEMIREAQKREMPYAFIGMDTHYGQQPWLLAELEADDECYIADVPCDIRVWRNCPKTQIPKRKSNRGRLPTKRKLVEGSPTAIEVREIAAALQPWAWHREYVRDTQRGQLFTRIACLRVFPVRDELPGPATWLIIREDEPDNKLKYQLSNADQQTPFSRLAYMSHSRYWIERAIQDAKGEAGLDQYQVRGWRAWHHHMTMVLLAMLFLLELQHYWESKAPLLTLRDVREILEVTLPKRQFSATEILLHIEQKHRARDSARRSHQRIRQQKNDSNPSNSSSQFLI